jgi:glycosyltransferase involved in cell wall biosynthesis
VITGKTFQFLAMAKPIIIGKHQGSWDGFVDKQNCLYVPQGDANSLADVISWAFEHPRKLSRIGRCGYELFKNDYSIEKISEKLREIIKL